MEHWKGVEKRVYFVVVPGRKNRSEATKAWDSRSIHEKRRTYAWKSKIKYGTFKTVINMKTILVNRSGC